MLPLSPLKYLHYLYLLFLYCLKGEEKKSFVFSKANASTFTSRIKE